MITTAILNVFAMLPTALMFFIPNVTELPFGMDPAISLFTGTLRGIINTFPWLLVVYQVFITALAVKFALFTWRSMAWAISIIRG